MAGPSDAPAPRDALLARAAAALQGLSGEMNAWLGEEVRRLEAAGAQLLAKGDVASAQALRLRAHDLKGLGGTCRRPLLSRVGASLERLMDAALDGGGRAADLALVRAHLDLAAALAQPEPGAASGRQEALEAAVQVLEAAGPPQA